LAGELETSEEVFADAICPLGGAVEVWLEGGEAGAVEQQPGAVAGLGAETPAISEPSPSFCSVGASSLPFASIPFADWNFWTAATVFESHLPFASP